MAVETPIREFEVLSDDLVMSIHGCGLLTGPVLSKALNAGARVAVLPCCHDLAVSGTGGLDSWIDGPLAVDVTRAARLRADGYRIITRRIPDEITPKNRLLMGHPDDWKIM